MNLLCTEKQKMNSSTVLLFAFAWCLHYSYSVYICSIGNILYEEYSSFLHTLLMLTDSPFVIKNTNSIVTILIANLLTLGIIRTVDIFTVTTRLTTISKETSRVSCLPWIPIPKLTTDFIIYLLVKLALTKQMQLHLAEEILEQKIVDWKKAKLSPKRS